MRKQKTEPKKQKKTRNDLYTGRFKFLMRLIRINKMLRTAIIIPAGK